MPKVSIILPTFNRAPMLPRSIESVLGQTFTDWELVVMNDGSTDETPQILAAYEKQDPRIRVMTQKNSGLCKTRNAGVRVSKGEYLTFLDDDDTFAPDKLERQAAYLDANPACDLVYSHLETTGTNCPLEKIWPVKPATTFGELIQQCTIQPNAVLVRKAAFERFGNFRTDLKSSDDYEMWLRIAYGGRIDFLPGVVGTYHWHENNLSRNTRQRSKSVFRIYRSFLKRNISSEAKKLIREFVGFKNYIQASDALEQKRYDAARYHFLCSLRIDSRIGLSVPWNPEAPGFYRFLRPYLGLAYSFLKSSTTSSQPDMK